MIERPLAYGAMVALTEREEPRLPIVVVLHDAAGNTLTVTYTYSVADWSPLRDEDADPDDRATLITQCTVVAMSEAQAFLRDL